MVRNIMFGASPREARQDAGNDESDEGNGRGHSPHSDAIQGKTSQVTRGPTI